MVARIRRPGQTSESEVAVDIVDDEQLLMLAQEPARELIPAAQRASSLKPLLVLLALLPGLLLFRPFTMDDPTAESGLAAWEVASQSSPIEWLVAAEQLETGSGSTAGSLSNLVTALGLRLELFSPENRLRLVASACSVLLLLSMGGLAVESANMRVAICAVLLACIHRDMWSLSHHLPPVSLPLVFSLLAFRCLLSHQAKDEAIVSWPLVGSGMALAACWLCGSAIAGVTWCVIGGATLFTGFCFRSSVRSSTAIRQCVADVLFRGISFGVVSLVAVMCVLTWKGTVLGAEFDSIRRLGFSDILAAFPKVANSNPTDWSWKHSLNLLATLSGGLSGLVVLGFVVVARSFARADRTPKPIAHRFILIWTGMALVTWSIWGIPSLRDEFNFSRNEWFVSLLLPLLLLAALGIDAVLKREFSLRIVAAAAVFSVATVIAPWDFAVVEGAVRWETVTGGSLALLLVTLASVAVIRWLSRSECRRRGALILCLAAVVVLELTLSVRSLRPASGDERELFALRRQLASEPAPQECWLISDGALPTDVAPSRLKFFLRSQWRDCQLRLAKDWETMFVEIANVPSTANRNRIVVTWGSQKLPVSDVKQWLTQITEPLHFQHRSLKAFRWSNRAEKRVTETPNRAGSSELPESRRARTPNFVARPTQQAVVNNSD